MNRQHRIRSFSLALAAAAAWTFAPGDALAERGDRRDRTDRQERFERDRDQDRDRDYRRHHDKYEKHAKHQYRSDWRRFERDRHARRDFRYDRRDFRHDRRHDRWDRRYDRWGRSDHRYRPRYDRYFVRHELRRHRTPFYCSDHRAGFFYQDAFNAHLLFVHGIQHFHLPRLTAHLGFGWTFGH